LPSRRAAATDQVDGRRRTAFRFTENAPSIVTDNEDCYLRIARRHFKTNDEYVRATGGGLSSEDATEAGKAYINEAIDRCV
jgi:hypothetical protein